MSFDDDLDQLHADADAAFGVAGTFKPLAGPPSACVVELTAPEAEYGFGNAKAIAADAVLRVSVSALTKRPVKGDRFETTARGNWRVVGDAMIEDDDQRRYAVKVERA